MRSFLTLALEKAGHQVRAEEDGLAAWRTLEGEQGDAYDLLVADIVMPGMDGIELSKKAGKLRPGLKVMFITGFAAVAVEKGAYQIPGAQVLSKPFHLNDLVEQVETLLAA